MGTSDNNYDSDPLYIKPTGFLVYDPESDWTELVMGNTNMLQRFAVWENLNDEVYYVNVNKLSLL